ncbi:LysE family transporter [Clostridium sp. YIM B02515]|uniref:LysE family transporter n=1 Tax=Clostridium rhizosphaerae TaxID=2803861 RepID=A0ABS1TGY0_9CLOT|nr:LysE family transporter [Clostridium rhizosphaerae]MBL4938560.1 LysE family transporter [Clostridium rhizosphaerae]
MIYKGFKFGMLLQLAVGPMCLMVFNTSTTYGFLMGLSLVLAISLVDGLYIILSGLGVAMIINKEKIKSTIKILGCIVLVLFGVNTATGAFGFTLLPDLKLFSNATNHNVFLQGVLLTASNPLTIIFWGSVFSSQVAENDFSKKQLVFFGIGCILSTISFLTIVAFLGSILSGFLPQIIIQILNFSVGIILIYFGIKLLLKK